MAATYLIRRGSGEETRGLEADVVNTTLSWRAAGTRKCDGVVLADGHRCVCTGTLSLPAWLVQLNAYLQKYVDKGLPERAQPQPPCSWCGFVPRRSYVCKQCRSESYCCWQCQFAAWDGGHWAICGSATKLRSRKHAFVPRIEEDEA